MLPLEPVEVELSLGPSGIHPAGRRCPVVNEDGDETPASTLAMNASIGIILPPWAPSSSDGSQSAGWSTAPLPRDGSRGMSPSQRALREFVSGLTVLPFLVIAWERTLMIPEGPPQILLSFWCPLVTVQVFLSCLSHTAVVVEAWKPEFDSRPWRYLNHSMVYLSCAGHGYLLVECAGVAPWPAGAFEAAIFTFDVFGAWHVWSRAETEGKRKRFGRMGMAGLSMFTPLGWAFQRWDAFFSSLGFALGAMAAFALDRQLCGWGVMLCHLLLVACFVLQVRIVTGP